MIKIFLADLRYKQNVLAEDGSPSPMLKVLLSDGSGANFIYRLMQMCSKSKATLVFAYLAQYANKLLNHCVIGVKADFGPGLVLMHPTGVVINSKVRGANNIVLESGVVIGDDKGKSPVLGRDLFVGAGAKIIGGVSVGDSVKIGANAVVVKDIPSNTTAVGIPARPLS